MAPQSSRRRRSNHTRAPRSDYTAERARTELVAASHASLEDLVDLAEGALAGAGLEMLFPHAERLALELGFVVNKERAPDQCGLEGVSPRELFVRRCKAGMMNLRIFHELAHALLRRARIRHGHGDVWALTLMLAVPRSSVKHVELADHVPK